VAGWSALRSWDLKRVLAHSTAAYLGLVTAYYGYIGASGLHDDLMLVANHALYKSALFLLVGWIEKVTGTRDLRTLTPERWVQHVPVGAALFAVGVLARRGPSPAGLR
jgi:NADH:ubiquinone oxidoreductase subunit 5 (subunit L)/multisubunit Na+/H+ antiporter MnhA subunit